MPYITLSMNPLQLHPNPASPLPHSAFSSPPSAFDAPGSAPPDPSETAPLGGASLFVTDTTIYFTQLQLASLLHVTKQTISYHLRRLHECGQLSPRSVLLRETPNAGGRPSLTLHYSLDVVLALIPRLRSCLARYCAKSVTQQLATVCPQFFPPPNLL